MKELLLTILILIANFFGIELNLPEDPQPVIQEEQLGGELITSKLEDPQEVIKIDSLKTEIDDLQKDVKEKEKYIQVLRTTNKDGIDYEVHEYKTPSGETGYQKILYLDNGEIISEGFGAEALSRTYHFIPEVPVETPTST